MKFDTLLIDCEGCGQYMTNQIFPLVESGQVKLILLEADMPNKGGDCTGPTCMDYAKFFKGLEDRGMEQVDKFNDCDKTRLGKWAADAWCGSWIDHYAFKRK